MPWYQSPTPIQKDFSRRRARQWLIAVPFALGLLVLPICIEAARAGHHDTLARISLALLWVLTPVEAGLFGLAAWNWRCPACRHFLGNAMHPRACAHCGAALCQDGQSDARNPFWTLLQVSLKALRAAHDVLHGVLFMIFGACLGAIGGVWLGVHLAPKSETALMVGGAVFGFVAGGLIALSALRPR